MSYVINGFPSEIVKDDHEDNDFLVTDNGFFNESVPTEFIGDVTGQVLVAPSIGHKLTIKGITILGNGNQGTIKVKRSSNSKTLLPAYFSAQARAGTSAALNIKLAVNEYVYVDTNDRTGSETFIGVSYIEMKG